MALSGVFLYVAPQCRVAEEIGWTIMGLGKAQWGSIHMATAVVFLVLAAVHLLVYNLRIVLAYAKNRPAAGRRCFMRPELACSLLAAAVIIVGAAIQAPPFKWLPEGHKAIEKHHRENAGFGERGGGDGGGGRGGGGSAGREWRRP